MQIDPHKLDHQEAYKLINGGIVPRPIAWVSSVDQHGLVNLAPYSFFNGVGSNPLALSISIMHAAARPDGKKDTLRNIEQTGQFVVNLVSERLATAMNITAADFPPGVSEFEAAMLEAVPSTRVRAPRVAEAMISFECELHTLVPVGEGPGSATVVIGKVLLVHVRDQIIDQRYRIDLKGLQPVARLSGNDYARIHETFSMVRPRYDSETGEIIT
ncbi:MAG: flavin reductase family protein [Roseiflexaceae bacterium]|nr:flavin reductase family protein [Roseiflexaceae bacterium]